MIHYKELAGLYKSLIKPSRVLTALCVLLMIGCSNGIEQRSVDKYLKTFDHIHTDQYIWYQGQGGIFWVSDDRVLLDAKIENTEGTLDRGLYQVDVTTGNYQKVVDVPEEGPTHFKYCFDGSKLHVMTSLGTYTKTELETDYQVEIRGKGELKDNNHYSSFRCDYVSNPNEERGYKALRLNDGFIKFKYEGAMKSHVFLTDDQGQVVKKLLEEDVLRKGSAVGLFSVSQLLKDKDSYFGYSPWDKKSCTKIWRLNRDGWKLETQDLCLSSLSFGSKLIHDLRNALYIEHYTTRASKSYILLDDKKIEIEEGVGRGASSSPDGCKVAYGVGNKKKHQSPARQKLKVFNYCGYISKEERS